jgi:Secretion system C-terminal sorting domain
VTNYGEVILSPMTSAYSFTNASASIESTPQEMAEWYNSLFSGNIISDASLQEVLNFDQTSLYGLGIGEVIANGRFCYAHGGEMIGCLSQMLYDVQTKSVMSIITNQRVIDFSAIVLPLVNVLFNEYPRQQNDAGITKIITPWENSCSTAVIPLVVLTNFGSAPLNAVDIHYKIDGVTPGSFHWTGTLNSNDSTNVVLPQITTGTGPHSFSSYTTLPNGAPEGNTYNDTTKSNFIVNASLSVLSVLYESFDDNAFPPAGWAENSSSIYQWGKTSLARYSGSGTAAKSNYYDGNIGAFYDLDLPIIHIADGTHPALDFEYAYAMYPGYYGDSLHVYISTDCGATWQTLFYKGAFDLHTASSTYYAFYPQSNAEWKQESFSLAAFPGDALIRFRDVCGFGNNLFLDDVNVSFPTGVTENKSDENFSVYPNPASSDINISGLPVNSEIRIADLTGKLMMTQKTMNSITTIDIQLFPQGVYILSTLLGIKKIVKL